MSELEDDTRIVEKTTKGARRHSIEIKSNIKGQPSAVAAIFRDYQSMPIWIPGLRSATVVSHESPMVVAFDMKLPFPVGKLQWTNKISHTNQNGVYKVEWTYVDGVFLDNAGLVTFAPHPSANEYTVANYHVVMELKTKIPMVAQRIGSRWLVPRAIDRLRNYIEETVQKGDGN